MTEFYITLSMYFLESIRNSKDYFLTKALSADAEDHFTQLRDINGGTIYYRSVLWFKYVDITRIGYFCKRDKKNFPGINELTFKINYTIETYESNASGYIKKTKEILIYVVLYADHVLFRMYDPLRMNDPTHEFMSFKILKEIYPDKINDAYQIEFKYRQDISFIGMMGSTLTFNNVDNSELSKTIELNPFETPHYRQIDSNKLSIKCLFSDIVAIPIALKKNDYYPEDYMEMRWGGR